jgi:hypothetical protein
VLVHYFTASAGLSMRPISFICSLNSNRDGPAMKVLEC